MRQYPALLFTLLTNPPENADEYKFDSVAVKEPRFEIDGVFLPPENESHGIYIVRRKLLFGHLSLNVETLLYITSPEYIRKTRYIASLQQMFQLVNQLIIPSFMF